MQAKVLMSFLDRGVDEEGYPSMEFEEFYQQGVQCFVWRLPETLKRQAFHHLCNQRKAKGKPVEMWQIRAFVFGSKGRSREGVLARRVGEDYEWPEPPDGAWRLVVCCYPDGFCDLDFVHPVSRAFWSEDNGFLSLPTSDILQMARWWFERMGFDVLIMQPTMTVRLSNQLPHLKLIARPLARDSSTKRH